MHFDGAIAVSMIPMSRRRPKLKIDFSLRTDNQTGTQHNSHVVEADLGHRKTNLNFKRRGGANLYLPKSEKSMLYLRKYGKWLFVSPFRRKKWSVGYAYCFIELMAPFLLLDLWQDRHYQNIYLTIYNNRCLINPYRPFYRRTGICHNSIIWHHLPFFVPRVHRLPPPNIIFLKTGRPTKNIIGNNESNRFRTLDAFSCANYWSLYFYL